MPDPFVFLPDTLVVSEEAIDEVIPAVQQYEEHAHTVGAAFGVYLQEIQPVLHGTPCAAHVRVPRHQGPGAVADRFHPAMAFRRWFDGAMPQFIITIDAALWRDFDASRRECLVSHELLHIQPVLNDHGILKLNKDGTPMLELKEAHDTEVFDSEIIRWGPGFLGLEHHCTTLAEGLAREQRRGLKLA